MVNDDVRIASRILRDMGEGTLANVSAEVKYMLTLSHDDG